MTTIEKNLSHISNAIRTRDLGNQQEAVILAILLDLGMPTKLSGFRYAQTAIKLYCEDTEQSITKCLYPAVAKSYQGRVSAVQVERALRTVIQAAWKVRDNIKWEVYFPANQYGKEHKPTNWEFISRIACLIELWEYAIG